MKKNSQPLFSAGADTALSLEDQMAEAMSKEIAREIDNEVMWSIMLEINQGWHPVELTWNKTGDENYFWNEACAWAVENFGLPGDRYVTHPNERHMLFLFKHSEDAVMMTLKWT